MKNIKLISNIKTKTKDYSKNLVNQLSTVVELESYPDYNSKFIKKEKDAFFSITSTTISNIFIFIIFCSLFFIGQTQDMIWYGIKYVEKDPFISTLWSFLLGFTIFIFSQSANLKRDKFIRRKYNLNLKATHPNRLDTMKIFMYFFPIFAITIILICNIYYSIFELEKNLLFSINPISLLLMLSLGLSYLYFVLRKKNNEKSLFVFKRLIFFCLIGISIFYVIPFYEFVGSWGIAIYDICLIWLCWVRIFIYLYHKYFNILQEHSELNFKGKLTNSKTRKSIISLILLSLFLYVNLSPFCFYDEVIKIKSVEIESSANVEIRKEINEGVNSDIREDLSTYVENWLKNTPNNKEPIYMIAGQGGGSRAGYWTSYILDSLSNKDGAFMSNCLAVSTVSGSSVGATLFMEAKRNNIELGSSKIKEFFHKDFVSRSLANLFFVTPLQKLFSLPRKDKNEILIEEEADRMSKIFCPDCENKGDFEILYDSTNVYLTDKWDISNRDKFDFPLLIYNTYNITTKKKSVISPVKIYEDSSVNQYEDFLSPYLCDPRKRSITIGQAVNLSQMFPIMSTSAIDSLRNQYYDGGVYDNSGLSTINDIYSVLQPLRDKYSQHRKIIIYYLKNSNDDNENEEIETKRSAIGALIKAATGSIFSASPRKYVENLKKETTENGDQLFDNIFVNNNSVTLNRWLSNTQMGNLEFGVNESFEKFEKIVAPKIKQREVLPKKHLVQVFFRTGKTNLDKWEKDKIDQLISDVKPEEVVLTGYSDMQNNFDTTNNEKIATDRAKAVKDYLLSKKYFKKDEITIASSRKESGNNTHLSMQNNRKVDIEFLFYKSPKFYYTQKIND